MKKIIPIILFLTLTFSSAYAQQIEYDDGTTMNDSVITSDEENKTVTSENSYFELELVRGIQNPLTKKIPFTVYITPRINSEKTQILWDVPSVFTLDTQHTEFVSLQKDNTYTYSASVKPEREGTYDISVHVISWQFDTNRANGVSYTVSLNKSLTVQPRDSEYTIIVLLLVAGILLVSIIGTFFVIKGVKVLIEKLKVWLTPPF